MSVQFLWPFDELMIRFHEMVIGASRHAMFAERTGISERRWRDPTKQFRPTTVMKAMNHARERILDDLRKRGFDEVERLLAAIRVAGGVVDDLRLTQADLEDVFVGVMQGSQGSQGNDAAAGKELAR